jgi:C-terminal processing protease CtpA/Prc
MDARKIAWIAGWGLLLCAAVAAAGERGYFGFGMAVKGGGFFLNPTIESISIAQVVPGSPTAQARIAVGDRIVKVEGIAIAGRKASELKAAAAREVGQTLHLELKRPNGQVYSAALVAVPRPD